MGNNKMRRSDPRTCELCHKAIQYAEHRMYCRNIQTGGDASIGLKAADFNEEWRRMVAESLYPHETTINEYLTMAFHLLERAFPDLHRPTMLAFKRAMWLDDGQQVILCHPSWQDVDEYMLPQNTGKKAAKKRRANRRNAERHAANNALHLYTGGVNVNPDSLPIMDVTVMPTNVGVAKLRAILGTSA